MPETEYVPPQKPLNVVTYCKVWTDYTGTSVRSILNVHVDTQNEFALSHVQGPMANMLNQRGGNTSEEWPRIPAYVLDSQMPER